jgi:hypothetical protein
LDAFNEYTKAIALNPTSHVYYSNRAIACIKLFRFEQVRLNSVHIHGVISHEWYVTVMSRILLCL